MALKGRWKNVGRTNARRKSAGSALQQSNQPLLAPACNNENDEVKAPVLSERQFALNPGSSGWHYL